MPTRYRYQQVISNGHSTRVIRGMTKAEVNQKVAEQQATWQRQAAQRQATWQAQLARQAVQDELRMLEAQAQAESEEAQSRHHALQNLLRDRLRSGKPFRWDDVKDHRQFPPFEFREILPTYEGIAQRLGVPAPSALEGLLSGKRKKREELEAQARAQFEAERANHEARKAAAYRDHEQRRATWTRSQDEYNASIDVRRQHFEQGDPEAVKWVITRILGELDLPEDYGKDFDVAFEESSGIAVVNMPLPTLDEVPRIQEPLLLRPGPIAHDGAAIESRCAPGGADGGGRL